MNEELRRALMTRYPSITGLRPVAQTQNVPTFADPVPFNPPGQFQPVGGMRAQDGRPLFASATLSPSYPQPLQPEATLAMSPRPMALQPASAPDVPLPPARPADWNVPGYQRGLRDFGPDAQTYANQFTGGDVSKVRSRLVPMDGEMMNDFYARGLLDSGTAPQAAAPETPPPQQNDFWSRLFGGIFSGGV